MVRVRSQTPIDSSGDVDVVQWCLQLPVQLSRADLRLLVDACGVAQNASARSGVDPGDWGRRANCFRAGLEMTQILAELHVDAECLIAAVLYRSVREERLTLHDTQHRFGGSVATLIKGVLRMASIGGPVVNSGASVLGQANQQKDNIRKMLIALVDDVRVALIKLAERTCALRAAKEDQERRQAIGREVVDIYAPLAHRLGIGQLKWELEDLSFRYLQPDTYRKIARLLDGRRIERDQFIQSVKEQLSQSLHEAGFKFEIEGRAKHIYSIWRKMQRKGIGFSQVYDILAVRILVPEIANCYATLGLVHGLWRNIPNEFDDYIASPKENGYRSLHTAVIGPEGKVLEVQIRTFRMHEEAELGVCSHWRYKGSDAGGGTASTYEQKIAWLRHVLDWHEETGNVQGVIEQISFEGSQDRIYIFTPRGDVVDLAQGATPLDFAYHVHTEIGHRCRGAKVNGSIVPLTYPLKTGERVEVLTAKEASPRRDWLQNSLGYLRTSRARLKVQQWFRSQAREDNINTGRHLLDKEFRRLALTSVDYQRIARKVQCNSVEDMYAAVGAGDLSSTQVSNAAQALLQDVPVSQHRVGRKSGGGASPSIQVSGVGNLLTHMAGCCKPLPGDAITGFVTRHRGVSVHRTDCGRLVRLQEQFPGQVIDVDWGAEPVGSYEVDVAIEAYDRQGLMRDITTLFANARANVLMINTQTRKSDNTAAMRLRIEVPGVDALSRLLERIERLNNVITARRVSD